MSSLTFYIEGEVKTKITVTEQDDGTLRFDVDVLDETGQIGDLRALYFDLANDSLTSSLTITGDDVTDTKLSADGVLTVGGDTNINGEVIDECGRFDVGIEFGTSGIAKDDVQTTSFTVSSDAGALTLDDIMLQDFGIRLTSVGEDGGEREYSLKLDGVATAAPDAVDEDWFGTNESTPLFGPNVLANDTSYYEDDILSVTAVNGDAANVGNAFEITSEGGRTGSLTITDDGSLFFDPGEAFLDLNDGETDIITATYQAADGYGGFDTATVSITIYGMSEWDDFPVLG